MISRRRLLFLTPLATILACASQAPLTVPTAPAGSGDYVLSVTPAPGSPATSFTGNLYVSGSSANGAFQYNNPNSACSGQSFPVAGNVAANGVVTLSSSSFAGSFQGNTATIAFLLLPDTGAGEVPYSSGMVQIAAGAGTNCALANSSLTASYVPPYSGTWTGAASLGGTTSVTPPNGLVVLFVTEVIPGAPPQQASAANATGGTIPVTGSIAFISATYPMCNFATPIQLTGQIGGYNLQLASTSSNPAVSIQLNSSTNVNFSMTVGGGKPCGGTYSGILTQQ
jgi:hypothetical protein